MTEIIDQPAKEIHHPKPFKLLSLVLLCLSMAIVLFTSLKLWYDHQNIASPWLPKYTIYFLNGIAINFAIIQFAGVIPAFYLYYRKHYAVSSYCLISFILLGQILKSSVRFYTLFY